jgi:hypothetical protein
MLKKRKSGRGLPDESTQVQRLLQQLARDSAGAIEPAAGVSSSPTAIDDPGPPAARPAQHLD